MALRNSSPDDNVFGPTSRDRLSTPLLYETASTAPPVFVGFSTGRELLGKRFDYMAYPNRDHGLREGKGTEVHLRMLIIRYLIEHCNPGPR